VGHGFDLTYFTSDKILTNRKLCTAKGIQQSFTIEAWGLPHAISCYSAQYVAMSKE
jgi:hypothetical protein